MRPVEIRDVFQLSGVIGGGLRMFLIGRLYYRWGPDASLTDLDLKREYKAQTGRSLSDKRLGSALQPLIEHGWVSAGPGLGVILFRLTDPAHKVLQSLNHFVPYATAYAAQKQEKRAA